jgi:peroxiredoxin
MKAWEENSNSKNITMIADGNGNLTDSLDLAMDGSAFSLGKRCQRFAMIIQDGIIKEINTENGPGLDRSSAESILKSI